MSRTKKSTSECNGPDVALIHNIIAPYRNDLFEELGKHVSLRVYFCMKKSEDRLWDSSLQGYTFNSDLLKNIKIGAFVLNYSLPIKLLRRDHDLYIVADTLPTIISTLFTLLVAKAKDKPFIVWSGVIDTPYSYEHLPEVIHDLSVHPLIKRMILIFIIFFERYYRWILYRQADAFVAYSNKAKEYLINQGVEEDDIFVGGQIMPESQISEPPTESDEIYKDKTVILSLSYLRDVKGIHLLIEAISDIDDDDLRLIIAGEGEQRTKLENLAADDNRISFVGYADSEMKARYYTLADMFVLPTFHDPWGLVINEAMYYGLPIITTNAAASADHLICGNGYIIPPNDSHALKVAISALLEDEQTRKRMSKRSKDIITEYNKIEKGVKPFIAAIEHACNSCY